MAAADVVVKCEEFIDNDIHPEDGNSTYFNIYESRDDIENENDENRKDDNENYENDDIKMQALLREFDLEILFTLLKFGDITYRSLKYISENDINAAIRSIAYRAEFREKLFAWRRDKYGLNDFSVLPPPKTSSSVMPLGVNNSNNILTPNINTNNTNAPSRATPSTYDHMTTTTTNTKQQPSGLAPRTKRLSTPKTNSAKKPRITNQTQERHHFQTSNSPPPPRSPTPTASQCMTSPTPTLSDSMSLLQQDTSRIDSHPSTDYDDPLCYQPTTSSAAAAATQATGSMKSDTSAPPYAQPKMAFEKLSLKMSRRAGLSEALIENFLAECDNADFEELSEEESAEEDTTENIPENISEDIADNIPENIAKDTDEEKCFSSDSENDESQNMLQRSSVISFSKKVVRGKNGHIWSVIKGKSHKRELNIVLEDRGPTRQTKNLTEPLLCFEKFITDDIMDEIVQWTNVEIEVKRANYSVKSATVCLTNATEIKALIGLLVLTAALKDNHLTTEEIFNTSLSGLRYSSTMSQARFKFLLNCLRFDDKSLRMQIISDKFSPIRKVWEMFLEKCRENYNPGLYMTIDEQLLAFRGRCSFRMFVPKKPAKYGLKIIMLCDSGTKYMVDAMPYLGKNTNTGNLPLGEYCVKEITKTIYGSNRNVTMDNRFTSVPLAKSLLCEPYKLTIVGTLRSNKREIPSEMKNIRGRRSGTSMFCYDKELTLLSYKPKLNKMVYLLSSCNEEGTVNNDTNKPHMIEFYNQTEGGLDTFDQMCSRMSTSRKTNRWPLCMFYGILNMTFINSYVVYSHNMLIANKPPAKRRDFLKQLHSSLVEPWMTQRLKVQTLGATTKQNIRNIINDNDTPSVENVKKEKTRKYCRYCPYTKRRMTKTACKTCNSSICGEHKVELCIYCSN